MSYYKITEAGRQRPTDYLSTQSAVLRSLKEVSPLSREQLLLDFTTAHNQNAASFSTAITRLTKAGYIIAAPG